MSDKDKGFVFVATVGFLLALYLSNSYEEVSWKKFYSDFLEKGNVCFSNYSGSCNATLTASF